MPARSGLAWITFVASSSKRSWLKSDCKRDDLPACGADGVENALFTIPDGLKREGNAEDRDLGVRLSDGVHHCSRGIENSLGRRRRSSPR